MSNGVQYETTLEWGGRRYRLPEWALPLSGRVRSKIVDAFRDDPRAASGDLSSVTTDDVRKLGRRTFTGLINFGRKSLDELGEAIGGWDLDPTDLGVTPTSDGWVVLSSDTKKMLIFLTPKQSLQLSEMLRQAAIDADAKQT
jgi:hypothetical protein